MMKLINTKGINPGPGRSTGFSIIELLIAVLVMAVGILGIAGLQVVSLQQNRSALFRAEATQMANDIMDRIRANPAAIYAPVLIDAIPVSTARDCKTNSCTPVQMAGYDIASWKCALNPQDADGDTYTICGTLQITKTSDMSSSSLPQGAGSVTLTATTYEITVRWVDDRAGNTKSIVLRSQL